MRGGGSARSPSILDIIVLFGWSYMHSSSWSLLAIVLQTCKVYNNTHLHKYRAGRIHRALIFYQELKKKIVEKVDRLCQ